MEQEPCVERTNLINPNYIGNVISKLFPNIKKSTVRCSTTRKSMLSYKNIDIQSFTSRRHILFEDIYKIVPDNWFIFKKCTTYVIFGYFYDITFNGLSAFLHLKLSSDSSVTLHMNKQLVDLNIFHISNNIEFTHTSIAALFHCMKLLHPCQGYKIKSSKEHSICSSSVCTKYICKDAGGEIQSVLRHQQCMGYVPLSSIKFICKKCKQFINNKKKKNVKADEKENQSSELSKDEILSKLKTLAPNLHANQLVLFQSQILASNMKSMKGMRWDKDVISMALSLYNRNPAAYRDITQNSWLQLPSESLIKLYKNAVQQSPGIVPQMMLWMSNEAKSQNLTTEGYYGGIILDEMAIQEDIQIVHTKSSTKMFGLSDSGEDVKRMQTLNDGKLECQLANHVQQYVFSGLTGYRWPFANFPNIQAPPAEIFLTTWLCIDELYRWGFKPIYCCMDGSSNNRAFLKMHFLGNPLNDKMIAKGYKNPTRKIIFLMDPCHLIKKNRNSVLGSGFLSSHQRLLTMNGKFIMWKMWIDAYQWDRSSNSFQIHHKLCDEHIYPSSSQKMRNKLAFQCLDSDMLNLMKCYSDALNEAGQAEMTGVLEFLKYTSVLVELFSDSRPIKDTSDVRLTNLSESYNWLKAWEKEHTCDQNIHKRYKTLLTMETREDINYMYYGFMSLVSICLNEFKIDL